ncbi:MAG: hypothetical protein AUK34_09835 [Ignavibacteria bacterium CG2_30_36_16]|nr:MAG: hypothetical protein AUK34_09835 [Ignavibacteria bacterium CG2_30_36_16]
MTTEIIKIEGMSCMHCVKAVQLGLQKLNLLVKNVKVGSAEVEYDENKLSRTDIITAIEEAGYKVVS